MTPEERFSEIENLLRNITGLQARHDEAIAKHEQAMERHDRAIEQQEAQIGKQNAGIQDLIRVSGALIDSQTKTWDAMHALATNIDVLTGNLDKLSNTVDRFLKGLQKPNGNL